MSEENATQKKITDEMQTWVNGSVKTTGLYLTMVTKALAGTYDAASFSDDSVELFNDGMRDAARSASFALQVSAYLASQAPPAPEAP